MLEQLSKVVVIVAAAVLWSLVCVAVFYFFTYPAKAQVDSGPPAIIASDGKYLGDLDGNPYNANSVNNPYGRYGNPYGRDNVTNPYGKYGSEYSPHSPNFPYGRGTPRR